MMLPQAAAAAPVAGSTTSSSTTRRTNVPSSSSSSTNISSPTTPPPSSNGSGGLHISPSRRAGEQQQQQQAHTNNNNGRPTLFDTTEEDEGGDNKGLRKKKKIIYHFPTSSDTLRLLFVRYINVLRSNRVERMKLCLSLTMAIGLIMSVFRTMDNGGGRGKRGGGVMAKPVPRLVAYATMSTPTTTSNKMRKKKTRVGRGNDEDSSSYYFLNLMDETTGRTAIENGQIASPPPIPSSSSFTKHKRRTIDGYTSSDYENQKSLKNSKKYKKWQRDPIYEGDCVPMTKWQTTIYPSCNKLHEVDKTDVVSGTFDKIASGGYNDVFIMHHDIASPVKKERVNPYVLKQLTGVEETDFSDRNYHRVQRDATIMERLTKSPWVMNIYGFCSFAQIVDYGSTGNMDEVIWHSDPPLSGKMKLTLATTTAVALADAHDIDGNGISAISHGDYAAKQYIKIDGVYKLNDFNRGRYIRWNKKEEKPCTYTIGSNDGKFRAPEEYKYEPETAAIDIWALGSIFVGILTGHSVWSGYKEKTARKKIIAGELPPIDEEFRNGDDPVNDVLLRAIEMCYVYNPEDRPKAGEVAAFLTGEAERLGIDWTRKID